MRSMFRSVLVALVGVLAVGVVVVASASAALPEFQQGGKPLGKAVRFEAEAGGGETETVGGVHGPQCSYLVTGEITGPKEVANVVVKGTSCYLNLKPITAGYCTGAGLKEGEVVSAHLSGRIGYLPESQGVGLLLEATGGGLIEECKVSKECIYKLKASIIGKIGPLNKETTEPTLEFQRGTGKGEQLLTHFQGEEAVHRLESAVSLINRGQFEKTAMANTFRVFSEEAIEVRA